MPIFDQGYQHWRGKLAGHAWRWLAVTRQGVRQQIGRRRTKWLVATAYVPALMLATVLVFWGLLEQQSSVIQPFMFLVQSLPEEVRAGPKAYRGAVWTMAFNTFFTVETFFAMLLVLAVGPDLVSQDLRFNAMPLYFSRPIRRLDYFLGKLGVIAFFLGSVAIAPAVAAYLLGVAFSLEVGVIRDTWHLLAGSVAFGLVIVLSAGTLMLAISSMSRNSRLVGATWVGLWVVGNVTASVLQDTVKRDWCPVVSYTNDLGRIREELLDVGAARRQFLTLWTAGRDTGKEAVRSVFPFGRGRRRFRPPPPRPSADIPGAMPPDAMVPAILRTPDNLRHPWSWSAGVLAGLFALSAWTVSTRVKSMDRLR
jgi:ABC-2 type transport system permease protein